MCFLVFELKTKTDKLILESSQKVKKKGVEVGGMIGEREQEVW